MPLNANFIGATVDDQGVLTVAGASDPPGVIDTIKVTLVYRREIHVADGDNPGLSSWTVPFPDIRPAPERGESVFVVGVATRTNSPCDPFVWQGSFEIKPATSNIKRDQ